MESESWKLYERNLWIGFKDLGDWKIEVGRRASKSLVDALTGPDKI